jgi:hydroxymethylpyrimidine pyrophosphatase-like HAD family hydrolase
MWFFRGVATDLDGTLTSGDRIPDDVIAAIDAARTERDLILVTGRIGSELDRHFPSLRDHFDAVVTENGAVLQTAAGTRPLSDPVDSAVDKALADLGVHTVRGDVLLAISAGDAAVAAQAVADLGLDCQVIRNRGAAMILPSGVTKATGLLAALAELGLSPHNTIAIGDAENDLSLLRSAEVGVAVANAVPSLAAHADLVLARGGGRGVAALLAGPLLRGHQRLCPDRRRVSVGEFDGGGQVLVPGSQSSLLITGPSGSGKSYLAGLLAERWIDAGYSVLVVDPEGDHRGLTQRAGVHLVDAASHLPSPSDLLSILTPSHASLVLDLSGIDEDAQLAYLRRLPAAVAAERMRYGVPHWVVYDEAHKRAWPDEDLPVLASAAEAGTCFVTWRPELLPVDVERTVDLAITMVEGDTRRPDQPLRAMLRRAGVGGRPFDVGERTSTHIRHRHKYAATPLPADRRFYFHRANANGPSAEAASLEEFARTLRHCDIAALDHHLSRGDFSRWITDVLADYALGAELASIERDVAARRAASLERARRAVCDAIERRYLAPAVGVAPG